MNPPQFPVDGTPFIQSFHPFYSAVYVVLPPFIRMPMQVEDEDYYPSFLEQTTVGNRMSWRSVQEGSGLDSFAEVLQALNHHEFGGYAATAKAQLRTKALYKKICAYCDAHNIYWPDEDSLSDLELSTFAQLAAIQEYREVLLFGEFGWFHRMSTAQLSTTERPELKQAENIHCIATPDLSIAMVTEYETWYRLLLVRDEGQLEHAVEVMGPEGFRADENHNAYWWST